MRIRKYPERPLSISIGSHDRVVTNV